MVLINVCIFAGSVSAEFTFSCPDDESESINLKLHRWVELSHCQLIINLHFINLKFVIFRD